MLSFLATSSAFCGLEGDLAGGLDVLLEGVHALVVDEGLGFKDLALDLNSLGGGGGLGQLGALDLKTALGSGDVIVEQRGSTLKGGDLLLIDQLLLLGFLQTKGGGLQLLGGVIERVLNLHDVLADDDDLVIGASRSLLSSAMRF